MSWEGAWVYNSKCAW